MKTFAANRPATLLVITALACCALPRSARAGSWSIGAAASGGAGSTGCTSQAQYSSGAGGSTSTNPGFDNSYWAPGSCALTEGTSVTSPGATAVSASVSQSASGQGGFAGLSSSASSSAAANLATGILNLNATANCSTSQDICMADAAGASLSDTISVSGLTSTPTPVTLTMSLDGMILGDPGADSAVAGLFVVAGNAPSGGSGSGYGQCEWAIGAPTTESAYGCFNDGAATYQETDLSTYTTSGGSVDVTIAATLELTSAQPDLGFFFFWNETASVNNCVGTYNSGCGTTNDMDFLDTGALSLNTGGLPYTSASGVFLTEQGEAPEPSTAMMAGTALVGAIVLAIRRRGQRR